MRNPTLSRSLLETSSPLLSVAAAEYSEPATTKKAANRITNKVFRNISMPLIFITITLCRFFRM